VLGSGFAAAGETGLGLGCEAAGVAFLEAGTAPDAGNVADGELFVFGAAVVPGAVMPGATLVRAGVTPDEVFVPVAGVFAGAGAEFRGLG